MRKLLKISGFGNTTLWLWYNAQTFWVVKPLMWGLARHFEDFYILASLIILQSNLNYPDLDYLCFFFNFLELHLWCHQFKCINYSHSRIATPFFFSIKQNTCTQTPIGTEFVPLSKAVELTWMGRLNIFDAVKFMHPQRMMKLTMYTLYSSLKDMFDKKFICLINLTLNYPDFSDQSPWVWISKAWLYQQISWELFFTCNCTSFCSQKLFREWKVKIADSF